MKICFVFDKMLVGGIERVGITYIRMLQQAGHSIDAYVLDPHTEGILDELASICPVRVIPFARKACPEYAWTLAKRWTAGKFLLPFAYGALWLAEKARRCVWHVPGQYDVAIAFSGHLNDLRFVADGFVKSKSQIAWLHGALYEYALINQGNIELYRRIGNLIAVSSDSNELFAAYYPTDRFHMATLYNPVTLDESLYDGHKVEMLQKEHGRFLLMAARFDPPKEQAQVVEAIALLRDKGFPVPKAVFLGDGSQRAAVERIAEERGVREYCVFAGNHRDIVNYYHACYALVHATQYEGFGLVLVEAMLAGKPVISTDSKVGIQEILGNNTYGLLCRVGDAADMADKIERLCTDQALYAHYQSLCSERADAFSPARTQKQLQAYLSEITANRV